MTNKYLEHNNGTATPVDTTHIVAGRLQMPTLVDISMLLGYKEHVVYTWYRSNNCM